MVGQERYALKKIYLWKAMLCGLIFGLMVGLIFGASILIVSFAGVALLDDSFLNENLSFNDGQSGNVNLPNNNLPANSGDSGDVPEDSNPEFGELPDGVDMTGAVVADTSGEDEFSFSLTEKLFLGFLFILLSAFSGGVSFFLFALVYNLASMIGCAIQVELEDKSFETIAIQGIVN